MGRQQAARATRHKNSHQFHTLKKLDPLWHEKIAFTGNPVRAQVIAAAASSYVTPSDGKLRLLVFGGSQGAHVMAEIVPSAVERMSADLRARLSIVQQARAEDLDRACHLCSPCGRVRACAVLSDLPERMAAAHLVISARRLDGCGAFRHRPSFGSGAVHTRWIRTSSPMPVSSRPPGAQSASNSATSRLNDWPRKWRRCRAIWRVLPLWHKLPNPPAPSTLPSGWPIWS